jgi:hypothetical protein
LYRPLVFREPERVVHPGSWLEHIPFAFWIVEAVRPDVLVELGTHSGNSYASFAQAVQTLGLPASCYAVDTWQGDPQAGFYDEGVFTEWAAYHDRHFSAFSRLIRATFAEAAVHFPDGTVDLLHLDGCHTYEAVSRDFELWCPKLSRRGVMLFHDINVREGDFGAWRLWDEVSARFPSFAFLHGHGLGVLATGPEVPEPLAWLCSRATECPQDVSAVRDFFSRLGAGISARFELANATVEARGARTEAERLREEAERLQEVVKDGLQRERNVEAERDSARSQVTLLHAQVSMATADLDAGRAQIAHDALRISRLEESLARGARLIADLQERLGEESRRRIEPARGQVPFGSFTHAAGRIGAAGRKRLRPLRTAARIPGAVGLLPRAGRRPSTSALTFVAHPARLREAHVIQASGLFDESYYCRAYPDVGASRLAPLAHFVLTGGQEGRSPHPLFDSAYYLRSNPDVAAAGVNPLLHYCSRGAFERRKPHVLFDPGYYLDRNPDVANAGLEPLGHFLRFGAADGRDPNPWFDCTYYLSQNPDVARTHVNPLVHFVVDGWREGRRPSRAFDPAWYLSEYPDIRQLQLNPLAHYIEVGRSEGRLTGVDAAESERLSSRDDSEPPQVRLDVTPLAPSMKERPTVVCLSHVMPWPPRAGNEYRIYRLLHWLRDQGYRIVPVIAPLPGDRIDSSAVRALADQFSNAVLCGRDGRVEYVLRDVPDALASLQGEPTKPVSLLLNEDSVVGEHERQLLQMDRTFCHDALITTVMRLGQVLRPSVLLAEYIWMSRVLPLVPGDPLRVIDTIDVFSTKREKVLQFGIDDLHVEPREEARRLRDADLILAIQDDERRELQRLAPGKRVVTTGVDFDVVDDGGVPSGRRVLYVGSDNPMNRKGLLDFLRFAWRPIRERVPDAELILAGRIAEVLPADTPGVIRLGLVADLAPLYAQARVVINPAVAGTGLKIKTLEALCRLRPIVTWPNGTDGLPADLAAKCTTVQDWFEFSHRVGDLLASDEPRLFSPGERDMIVRSTSRALAYGAMTTAIRELFDERKPSDVAGPAIAF